MKNNTLYIFLVILFLFGIRVPLNAQDDKYKDIIKTDGLKNKKYIVSLSGITDVELFKPIEINLGMSVSAGIRLLYKPKLNSGKSAYSSKVIEREIFIKPTFGYIYRKRFNTSFFFFPQLAYRHTFYKGVFTELNFDAGYMYAKMNAPTYERQPDGSFKKVNFGYHNLMLGGKFVVGYDFSKNKNIPLAVNIGSGIFYRYPSNQHWLRHIYMEVGLSYVFRKIIE